MGKHRRNKINVQQLAAVLCEQNLLDLPVHSIRRSSEYGRLLSQLQLRDTKSNRVLLHNMIKRNQKLIHDIVNKDHDESFTDTAANDLLVEEKGMVTSDEINKTSSFVDESKLKTSYSQFMELSLTNPNLFRDHDARRQFLREHLPERGIYCVLIFKGLHSRKKGGFVEYGLCKHSNCRKFRLETHQRRDNQVNIILRFDKGDDNHIGEEYAYRLSGKKRKEEKVRLLKELPNSVRHNHIEHGDMKTFQEGNWQNVRSLSVYQKARSEAKAESDLHQDSFIDLRLKSIQQTKGAEYIQFPDGREPKYFYSKDQINILVGRGKQIDAFFDATGSVVQAREHEVGHRVYYYPVVVKIGNEICPIAELITSKHDATTIACFFLHFKRFATVTCSRRWPLFNIFVVDWSFALICGACLGLNELNLFSYLKMCYRFVTDSSKSVFMEDLVKIRSCVSHFIKMISRQVNQHKLKKEYREAIVEGVAVLIQCTSMEDLSSCYTALMTILLWPIQDEHFYSSFQRLSTKNDNSGKFISLHEMDSEFAIDDSEYIRGKYTESPFYVHFFGIYAHLKKIAPNSIDIDNNVRNCLCCPELANYLTSHYMPFVPLWTAILEPIDKNSGTLTYSNATVECWFKIVKYDILLNERCLKIGRFVEEVQSRVKVILKKIHLVIGLKPLKSSEKHKPKDEFVDDTQCTVEESWRPKKKRNKYLSSIRLKKKVGVLHSTSRFKEGVNPNGHNGSSVLQKPLINIIEPDEVSENLLQISTNSNDSPGIRALPNGLLLSNEYYMSASLKCSDGSNFCVGLFHNKHLQIKLSANDYKTLNSIFNVTTSSDNRWVSDYCIDAAGISFTKNLQHIFYVDTISSAILFCNEQSTSFKKMYCLTETLDDTQYIFIPYNLNNSHWILIILDIKNKLYFSLDPMKPNVASKDEIFQMVKRFLSTRDRYQTLKLNYRQWKQIEIVNYPKQKDCVNCGMFVIYYMNMLCKGIDLNYSDDHQTFFPEKFRIEMQRYLLLSSDKMVDKCIICGSARYSRFVKCDKCERWVHYENCNTQKFDFENAVTIEYMCDVCKVCGQDPFEFVQNEIKMENMGETEIEAFVKQYRHYIYQIYKEKESNEWARRYRELSPSSYNKHLIWDYSTAHIPFDTSIFICKTIKTLFPEINPSFICYVMLGYVNNLLFNKFYGQKDDQNYMIERFQLSNGVTDEIDYPSPYTLDQVLDALEKIKKK